MIIKGELDKGRLLNKLNEISISFHLNALLDSEVVLNNIVVENKIRGMEVSSWVSIISAIPEVREMLVKQQQLMGLGKGVVMDGRDIGSVVFPDADYKFFLYAIPEIRAKRRHKEINDESVKIESIEKEIKERDNIDSTRDIAPLKKAEDAHVIDVSYLTIDQVFEEILEKIII